MVDKPAAPADSTASAPAARWGVGRAAIVAAAVSALVVVGLLEIGFWLGARSSTDLLLLALAIVPGICAGLVGNVRGSAVGTVVGVATGGLWVMYRLLQPNAIIAADQHVPRDFFRAFLTWMFGGSVPESVGWRDISDGFDPLRITLWTPIAILIVTNFTLAVFTAVLARHFHKRNTPPSLLAREWAAASSAPRPPRSTP